MPDTPTTTNNNNVSSRPGSTSAGQSNRPGAGGQQQSRRRRQNKSRYSEQMSEKQSLKKIYGIRENQLRINYRRAQRSDQQTGDQLIVLLESRLDNAIFRAGFVDTRPAARQMSSHGLLTINGRSIDVPSAQLKIGDVVAVKENKREQPIFANLKKRLASVNPPAWIRIDADNYSFEIIALPEAAAAAIPVDVQAIVEYFAR